MSYNLENFPSCNHNQCDANVCDTVTAPAEFCQVCNVLASSGSVFFTTAVFIQCDCATFFPSRFDCDHSVAENVSNLLKESQTLTTAGGPPVR